MSTDHRPSCETDGNGPESGGLSFANASTPEVPVCDGVVTSPARIIIASLCDGKSVRSLPQMGCLAASSGLESSSS